MTRTVKFTAKNGKNYSREFRGWIEPMLQFIRSLRNSYECEGYQCADAEETWFTGWNRCHVFTKAGCPNKVIEYYMTMEE